MAIRINSLVKLVDAFAKFAGGAETLKSTIVSAAQQRNIPNFIAELEKDNINANIKIGYTSGLKSLLYSELEVSPLQFERGIDEEKMSILEAKYKNVPAALKSYLTKHKLVPEGGPFIIMFP